MNKFDAMRAFIRVVEAGTFSKAADNLGVPKGQVSRLVQSLEHSLGAQLLNRSTRRVIATPDGAAYYEAAVRLFDEMEQAESRISNAKLQPRGRLRIDVSSSLGHAILFPAIGTFCDRYPDIHIDIGVTDRSADLLAENLDCALRVGSVTESHLVARRIGDIKQVLCAAPAYLERFHVPQGPQELQNGRHRLISTFDRGTRLGYVLKRGQDRHDVVANSVIAVDDASAMLSASLAGLGVAIVNEVMAAPHFASGSLIRLLPEWDAGAVPIHIVYPPDRRASAKLRAFIDWFAEVAARALAVPDGLAEPSKTWNSGERVSILEGTQHGVDWRLDEKRGLRTRIPDAVIA